MNSEKPSMKRTYGAIARCNGCRYWSEMMAKQEGNHALKAMCLNKHSKNAYLYTPGKDYCDGWASGEYGAIDDPETGHLYSL